MNFFNSSVIFWHRRPELSDSARESWEREGML